MQFPPLLGISEETETFHFLKTKPRSAVHQDVERSVGRVCTSCLVSLHLLLGQAQHLLALPTALTDSRRAGLVVLVPLILVYLNRRSLDSKNKIKNSLKNGKWEPFYEIKKSISPAASGKYGQACSSLSCHHMELMKWLLISILP